MNIDISKSCSDYIRSVYASDTGGKLKASHARELVAAFFGYKSHAALKSETAFPLAMLEEASYLAPDLTLLENRRKCLKGLPDDLLRSRDLAESIALHLQTEGHFSGDVWLYDSLISYVMEVLLHDNDMTITDQLSGVMAETNAYFDDPYYEDAELVDAGEFFEIVVDGTYSGENDPDRMFCGDKIDMQVRVTLFRVAGRVAFFDFDISAGGRINDDWVDPDVRFGKYRSPKSNDGEDMSKFVRLDDDRT